MWSRSRGDGELGVDGSDAVGREGESDGAGDELVGFGGAAEGDFAGVGIDVDGAGGEVVFEGVHALDHGDKSGVGKGLAGGGGFGANDAAGFFELGIDLGGREVPLDEFLGDAVFGGESAVAGFFAESAGIG